MTINIMDIERFEIEAKEQLKNLEKFQKKCPHEFIRADGCMYHTEEKDIQILLRCMVCQVEKHMSLTAYNLAKKEGYL